MKQAIGYYRVSTKEQGEHGHGIDGQRIQVRQYAERNDLDIVAEFEEHETGTNKRKRVEIYKALAAAKEHDAVLLIADISRLARSVKFITELQESGVKFVAIDLPSANEMTVQLMAIFAEEYARAVSKGTKRGLEGAKAKGIKLGNDGEYLTDAGRKKGGQTMRDRASQYYKSVGVYRSVKMMREQGDDGKPMSYRAIANALNSDGTRTRITKTRDGKIIGGKPFTAMTVKRIIDRNGAQVNLTT